MSSLAELARSGTPLTPGEVDHLHRLVASWGMLADFCFADLLLVVPIDGAERFLVMAQVRPTTGQTLYRDDMVGTAVERSKRQIFARAFELGEIVEGDTQVIGREGDGAEVSERVRVECIPVRHEGKMIAVICRETATVASRRPGELERIYIEIFDRFAEMISRGSFPFAGEGPEPEEAPRVGDGVIVLDEDLHVRYASPNAVSVLHRMDIHSNTQGMPLAAVGFDEEAVRTAMSTRAPVIEEVQRGDTSIIVRAIPIIEAEPASSSVGIASGAVVLMRDVSELRRRDRMLLSKDATIREIHHRVKNNLQTIASMLRLQARRLDSKEGRLALEESVRRVRAIALVHETLARESGDVVSLSDIVRPLVRMVEEGLSAPDCRISFTVEGDAGDLPADVTTSLAVVLNELMQNAADHAFPPDGLADDTSDGRRDGKVTIQLGREGDEVLMDVRDDGVGFPPGFTIEASTGLGLSIVHALVTTELGGSMSITGDQDGAWTRIRIPAAPDPQLDTEIFGA